LEERDAIHLFLDRARAQRDDVDGDDPAVLQVCRALDHLPLAIELAAARTSLLRPDEILPRLEDRFALLTRKDRATALPRQRTLRATVDWSYELLEPAEQQLFRRLAVFAGPFDLGAALALGKADALDVLARLVDKSLVVVTATPPGTRYRLLDTLRRYAWERLYAAGEVELARQLHLSHFLSRAESLFTPTDSVDGRTRELDEYLDDLRNAFEWCLKADNPTAGLRMIAATRDVWWRRSLAEGRRWAQQFLERCPEPSLARAQALQAAGLLEGLGNPQKARTLLLQARELSVSLDRATSAMVDYCLGFAAFIEEDAAAAIDYLEPAVDAIQALGDRNGAAIVSAMLGWVLLTEESRRAEARSRLERAHQVASELGDRYTAAAADYGLGLYWRWTGQPRRALDSFRHALEPLRGLEGTPILSGAMLHIARLLAASEPAIAARLAGAGLAVAERMGVHFAPRLLNSIEHLRADLEQRLGGEYARRAWADGQRLTAGEAIELALHDRHTDDVRPGGLTARELELAQLVARGLTSPQIGELLHVSPRTVDNHLARIYSKLGLASRVQLATWFRHIAASQSIGSPETPTLE
jgi:non-specific serine/threonine protein kinase